MKKSNPKALRALKREGKRRARLIGTIGGRGGVGKTMTATGIVDYLHENGIVPQLIDCDLENKNSGSFQKYFPDAIKISIHTTKGLDEIVELAAKDGVVTVADFGAGAGRDTFNWFRSQEGIFHRLGLDVTMVGTTTSGKSGVESILNWASELRDLVKYIVVLNHRDGKDFPYLYDTNEGKQFREAVDPVIINMEYRIEEVANEMEALGLTLRQALSEENHELLGPILSKITNQCRMESYFKRICKELNAAAHLFDIRDE